MYSYIEAPEMIFVTNILDDGLTFATLDITLDTSLYCTQWVLFWTGVLELHFCAWQFSITHWTPKCLLLSLTGFEAMLGETQRSLKPCWAESVAMLHPWQLYTYAELTDTGISSMCLFPFYLWSYNRSARYCLLFPFHRWSQSFA